MRNVALVLQNVCGIPCGMKGGECCNGTDCIGNDLKCDYSKTCVPKH